MLGLLLWEVSIIAGIFILISYLQRLLSMFERFWFLSVLAFAKKDIRIVHRIFFFCRIFCSGRISDRFAGFLLDIFISSKHQERHNVTCDLQNVTQKHTNIWRTTIMFPRPEAGSFVSKCFVLTYLGIQKWMVALMSNRIFFAYSRQTR